MRHLPPDFPFAILGPDLAYTIDGRAIVASKALPMLQSENDWSSASIAPKDVAPAALASGSIAA